MDKKTEEAKEFETKLREIYDNRVKNDSLMILFNKEINSQPPNLDMKCNDKWEPLKEPETDQYNFLDPAERSEFRQRLKLYKDARSYRERIEELEKDIDNFKAVVIAGNELLSHQEDQIEQLTKRRDELSSEFIALSEAFEQLQAEKQKVKEMSLSFKSIKLILENSSSSNDKVEILKLNRFINEGID